MSLGEALRGLRLKKWQCSKCGVDFASPTPGTLCDACLVAPSALPSRADILLASGVPVEVATTAYDASYSRLTGPRRGEIETWRGKPCFVTLAGRTGAGKTILATELLWRLIDSKKSRKPGWVRAGYGVQALAGNFGEPKRNEAAKVLFDSDALVLDDFGRQGSWVSVGEVVAHRYDRGMPTIVTTNLQANDIAQSDPATYRRISSGVMVGVVKEV